MYVGMRYWTPFIDDAMEQVRLVLVTVTLIPVIDRRVSGLKAGSHMVFGL